MTSCVASLVTTPASAPALAHDEDADYFAPILNQVLLQSLFDKTHFCHTIPQYNMKESIKVNSLTFPRRRSIVVSRLVVITREKNLYRFSTSSYPSGQRLGE